MVARTFLLLQYQTGTLPGMGKPQENAAANIRRIRTEKGLSLDALAERLAGAGYPMAFNTLSRLETGNRRIDVDDLVAIASALDVRYWDLMAEPEELVDPDVFDAVRAWLNTEQVVTVAKDTLAVAERQRDENWNFIVDMAAGGREARDAVVRGFSAAMDPDAAKVFKHALTSDLNRRRRLAAQED